MGDSLKHNSWLPWMAGILTTLIVFFFQNCGTMSVAPVGVEATSSNHLKASSAQLRCSDFNSYFCEEQIFSPDVLDMTHSLRECIRGEEICVDVEVQQHNTSSARTLAGVSEAQFQPGGEFNREETRCFHRLNGKAPIAVQGKGDSLAAALAKAIASCEANANP